jgi:peptidoglycan/xylan/chitin deacetylase (PgdA/CDA1 family)
LLTVSRVCNNFPLRFGAAEHGSIYLTFDDGPDPRWTPQILDLLERHGIQATFFMIGQQAKTQRELARRVLASGHVIGNHGWQHRHPWTLSARAAREEVRAGYNAIGDVLGQSPSLFRPAYGRLHPSMLQEATDSAQRVVLWSRSAIDWGYLGQAAAISRRLGATVAGDIVLMHDGERHVNRPDQLLMILPSQLAKFSSRQLSPCALPTAGFF